MKFFLVASKVSLVYSNLLEVFYYYSYMDYGIVFDAKFSRDLLTYLTGT